MSVVIGTKLHMKLYIDWLIDCKFISKNVTVTMTYNVWKMKMLKL